MGRGRRGQVVSQTTKREIKKIEARKGEDAYGFFNSKQKKGETTQVSEEFIEHLKKIDPELLTTLLIK